MWFSKESQWGHNVHQDQREGEQYIVSIYVDDIVYTGSIWIQGWHDEKNMKWQTLDYCITFWEWELCSLRKEIS